MSVIQSIREIRGVIHLSTDEGTIKIRKKYFTALPVEAGDSVDPDQYTDRIACLQAADAYEAALSILDYSEKSEKELETRLIARGYVPQAARSAVSRLVQNGLVNDRRYASRLAESAVTRPVGAYAVRRKLRAKGFDEDTVEEAAAAFDEDQQKEAAVALARQLARRYESLELREARQKLASALARRGFSWDAAKSAAESVFGDGWDD